MFNGIKNPSDYDYMISVLSIFSQFKDLINLRPQTLKKSETEFFQTLMNIFDHLTDKKQKGPYHNIIEFSKKFLV